MSKEIRAITVRLLDEVHKAFMKKLIDDNKTAQGFFSEKVAEYLGLDREDLDLSKKK